MTNRAKLLATAAVVLALGGAGIAYAHKAGHWRGPHHGGMGVLGFTGPMERMCRGNLAEKADHVLVRIEHRVKPTDAQKPAFETLQTAMRDGAAKIQAACPAKSADDDGAAKKTVPERLAMAEANLQATLDAVKTVRPAADAFYQTLNDDQKKVLAEMTEGRGWKKRHGWHGKGDGKGPGGPDGRDEGVDAPETAPGNKVE
ncbi:MAG: Spy/CpxP family protein refolding chaperone [Hyphomicrobium sp.]|nr:Spy/CpxP family protein refolding chaperone [Hyphomicrobium sp.]